MKISLDVDSARWLHLPRFADDVDGARRWEDVVIADMKVAWDGALDTQSEPFVREALRHGLRQVSETDAVTLQYWPDASIVNAVVHVAASPFAPGDEKQVLPLLDVPYVSQPVTTLFETEGLGAGVEMLYLTTIDEESSLVVGGVNYLFQNDFGYVAVGVTPTLPGLIGIMIEPLREVVRGIGVVNDTDGNWKPASIDEADMLSRGEQWSVDLSDRAPVSAEPTS